MVSITFNSSLLYKNIYSIIETAFSKNISNLSVTINYDKNDIENFSLEIEDTTSDLFNSEEYAKLVYISRRYFFNYFFGLAYIHSERDIELDENSVTKYDLFVISDFDQETINFVFSESEHRVTDYDYICVYSFSEKEGEFSLFYVSENREDIEQEVVSYPSEIYSYLDLCINRDELVSHTEWVDERYASNIHDLSRELRKYRKSNYFDEIDAKERLLGIDFFPDYDDMEPNGYDNYHYLVDTVYEKGQISEKIKNSLYNIDQDTYESITYQILSQCKVHLKSEGKPDTDKYLIMEDNHIYTSSIYIEKSEIEKWGEDYNCYYWLTQDKLDELINENDSDLDSYDIWQIYTGNSIYNYENEVEFICYIYISYDNILGIINNPDLRYSVKSEDNTVWEEEE